MDLNPQRVRTAEFKTAKRGLDPMRFDGSSARWPTRSRRPRTSRPRWRRRARAAVARLQELSDGAEHAGDGGRTDESPRPSAEQAETISRTLLLAQRTADTTIAQAEAESQRVVAAATEEAAATLDSHPRDGCAD